MKKFQVAIGTNAKTVQFTDDTHELALFGVDDVAEIPARISATVETEEDIVYAYVWNPITKEDQTIRYALEDNVWVVY